MSDPTVYQFIAECHPETFKFIEDTIMPQLRHIDELNRMQEKVAKINALVNTISEF